MSELWITNHNSFIIIYFNKCKIPLFLLGLLIFLILIIKNIYQSYINSYGTLNIFNEFKYLISCRRSKLHHRTRRRLRRPGREHHPPLWRQLEPGGHHRVGGTAGAGGRWPGPGYPPRGQRRYCRQLPLHSQGRRIPGDLGNVWSISEGKELLFSIINILDSDDCENKPLLKFIGLLTMVE